MADKEGYIPRITDSELEECLEAFGAVVIAGPKWCGKTTTAERYARSAIYLLDEDGRPMYEEALKTKPSLLLEGEKPRLIDEWQVAPQLWNSVRKSVDDIGEEGLYIMTSSTAANLREDDHSGSGRIVEMRMHTLSLFELGLSTGQVSLSSLFSGTEVSGQSNLTIEDLSEAVVRGGWPRTVGKSQRVASRQIRGYCEKILDMRIPIVDEKTGEIKEKVRDKERMRQVLRSLSRNESSATPDTTILKDILEKDNTSMDIKTLRDYIKALRSAYVVEDMPAWCPKLRSKATVRKSDTRHMCDPAIAANFLIASPSDLLRDLNTFGLLFESLVVRDLRVYSGPLGADVLHYHDSDGLEADIIVHIRHTGEWGAIEVKLGQGMVDSAAENLLKLRDKVESKPSFLAVVTGTEYAYTRPDGVHVIPIGCLRD